MPIYEYLCRSCGKITEAMQKFSDLPLADCELCGKAGALEKKISLSSFSLKGSGWYATDYKKKSEPASPSKPSETKSDAASAPAAEKPAASPGIPAAKSSE